MFGALRQGSLFYILDKGNEPKLKVGQVVSVSNIVPFYGQPLNMTVDVSVKVGNETMEFKQLPSNLSIANSNIEGIVVSEDRESMAREVESMIKTSHQILDSIPYHNKILSSCDGMLRELNPQFAKEKQQEEKIDSLESKVSSVESSLSEIKNMLDRMLNNKKE